MKLDLLFVIVILAPSQCGTHFIPARDPVQQSSLYRKKYHHLHPPQIVVDLQSKLLSETERKEGWVDDKFRIPRVKGSFSLPSSSVLQNYFQQFSLP